MSRWLLCATPVLLGPICLALAIILASAYLVVFCAMYVLNDEYRYG